MWCPSFSFNHVKGKASCQVAHTAGAYHGFRSIKQLGIFLLPPGWDVSLSQGYPLTQVPIYTPGWREALWEWSVLPKNTTQCPGQGSNSDRPIQSPAHLPLAHGASHIHFVRWELFSVITSAGLLYWILGPSHFNARIDDHWVQNKLRVIETLYLHPKTNAVCRG